MDNWRGIVVINVVSKVFSCLLEEKLREVAETVLGDTEVGYRKNRGGNDATFMMRRLMEEIRTSLPKAGDDQHNFKDLYMLFVDLRKAFDSVDRELFWRLLRHNFGVPGNIIRLLRLLHDGMHFRTEY